MRKSSNNEIRHTQRTLPHSALEMKKNSAILGVSSYKNWLEKNDNFFYVLITCKRQKLSENTVVHNLK